MRNQTLSALALSISLLLPMWNTAYAQRDGGPKSTNFNNVISSRTTAQIGNRFRQTFKSLGMYGVNKDVQKCYDDALSNKNTIPSCMLYDIASFKFDRVMRKLFEARGMRNPSADNLYLTDYAFSLRMQIYSGLAFNSSYIELETFFGDAPNKVIQALEK